MLVLLSQRWSASQRRNQGSRSEPRPQLLRERLRPDFIVADENLARRIEVLPAYAVVEQERRSTLADDADEATLVQQLLRDGFNFHQVRIKTRTASKRFQ